MRSYLYKVRDAFDSKHQHGRRYVLVIWFYGADREFYTSIKVGTMRPHTGEIPMEHSKPFTLEDFIREQHADVREVYNVYIWDLAVQRDKIPWEDISEQDRPFVQTGCTLREYKGYIYGSSGTTKMRGSFWIVELPEEKQEV